MASKRTVQKTNNDNGTSTMADPQESFALVPLADIFADDGWNARSGAWWDASGGPDESTGFEGLKQSIKEKGQDTPVDLRHNPKAGQKGQAPYLLVTGFRRFRAVTQLAKESGNKNAAIKAIIRNEDERSARERNLRENSIRDNLKAPDLAFGVAQLSGAGMNQTQIGLALGKSQSYVGKLERIMKGCKSNIVEDWRKNVLNIPYPAMLKIADTAPEKQDEAYRELVASLGTSVRNNASAGNRDKAITGCKTRATAVGTMLAKLEKVHGLDVSNVLDSEDAWTEAVEDMVHLTFEAPTSGEKAAVAGAARDAFLRGLKDDGDAKDKKEADKAFAGLESTPKGAGGGTTTHTARSNRRHSKE